MDLYKTLSEVKVKTKDWAMTRVRSKSGTTTGMFPGDFIWKYDEDMDEAWFITSENSLRVDFDTDLFNMIHVWVGHDCTVSVGRRADVKVGVMSTVYATRVSTGQEFNQTIEAQPFSRIYAPKADKILVAREEEVIEGPDTGVEVIKKQWNDMNTPVSYKLPSV